jgi:hypothetical protein
MIDPDFPAELRSFIRDYIPDIDAADLLLLLARNPDRDYDLAAMLKEAQPTIIPETAARRHLALFRERGLIASVGEDAYRYGPGSAELEELVHALTKVYNERPVTLVRVIYALKDEKIRSFADAFKLKK